LRRFLFGAVIAFAACFILVWGARTVGAVGDSPFADRFASCDQPCWRGIYPGETSFAQAVHNIRDLNDVKYTESRTRRGIVRQYCWDELPGWRSCTESAEPYTTMRTVSVWLESPGVNNPSFAFFTLGDALTVFGTPQYATVCPIQFNGLRQRMKVVSVQFSNGIEVRAYGPNERDERRVSPFMRVYLITFRLSDASPIYFSNAPAWRGFAYTPHSMYRC
jgi:hypothetical protein